jgi:long-chain acyl-CoA synthetase
VLSPTAFDAVSLVLASAGRFGERAAICEDASVTTYSQLLDRTGRMAGGLGELGVEAGDRVVLLLPNGARFVEAWWAVLWSGAVVVPLNPRTAHEELRFYIDNCGAACVITDTEHLSSVEELLAARTTRGAKAIVCVDAAREGVENYEALIARNRPPASRSAQALADPCAIYYTAGSTGRPKGVVRSHLSVAWGLAMLAQRLSPEDVLLARAPMAHTGGSLTGPFAVLAAGGTLVIPSRTDPDTLRLVQQHRVSRLYLHPVLSAKGVFASMDRTPYDLSSLRCLHWTAGFLPEGIRSEIFRRFPGLPLEVTYGMTEVSNIATYECDATSAQPPNCVGFAWPGSAIGIVGADGNHLPPGAGEGEIVVRSPTGMSGYWDAPDLTAVALRNGWLHTGDLGRLGEDGALFLTGRIKDVIKTAGMTVHPAEVEHALAAHPDVLEAAVFGAPHPHWEEAVTAVVALRAGSRVSETELIDCCRRLLSAYKLPKQVYFVEALPRNGSYKIDKRALVARYAGLAAACV